MLIKVTLGDKDYYLKDGSKVGWGYVQTFSDLIRQREGYLTRQDNQVLSRLRYGWRNGIGWARQDRETGRGEFGLRDSTWNTLHRIASYGLLNESQTHASDRDHIRKYQNFKSDFWGLFEETGPNSVTTGVATAEFSGSNDTWSGGGAVGTGIRAYDMWTHKGALWTLVGTLDGAADNIDVYRSTDGASHSAASATGWGTYDAGTPVGRTTNPFNDDYARGLDFGNTCMIVGWDEDGSGNLEIQYTTDNGSNWTAGAAIPSGSGPKAFVRWLDPFTSPPADSPVLVTAEGVYRVDSGGTTYDLIYALDGNPNNGRWSVVGQDGDLYIGLGSGDIIALHATSGGVVVRKVGPPGDGLVDERRGYVTFMLAPPLPWLIVGYGGHGPLEQASIFAIEYHQHIADSADNAPDSGRVFQPWHSLYLESDSNLDIVAIGYSTEDDTFPRLHFGLEGSSSDEMYHLEHPFTEPQVAGPQVQFDAVNDGGNNDVDSLTVSLTVGGNDNRAVYALVGIEDGTETAPTGVTFGGVAMTQIGSTVTNAPDSISLWRLLDPPSGASDCVATLAGVADELLMGVMSFYNVNQTTPEGTPNTATGNSTGPSVAVTSTSGDFVIDGVVVNNNGAHTAGASQTERFEQAGTGGTGVSISGSTERAISTSTTMSHTVSTGEWAIIGVAIQPVSRVTQHYQTSSKMQFAEDDAGDPHNDMTVHEARIEADNLGADNTTEYVEYKFGTDGAAWDTTDLGDFLSGDLDLVHGSGAGVSAKTLRNEIVGHRDGGDTTDTVLLKDFEVMASKTQQVLRLLLLEIDLSETAKQTRITTETVITNLEAVMKSSEKTTFKVGELPEMKVRIRQPAAWELEAVDQDLRKTRGMLTGFASVIVEEVLEGSPTS